MWLERLHQPLLAQPRWAYVACAAMALLTCASFQVGTKEQDCVG